MNNDIHCESLTLDQGNPVAEKNTKLAVILTSVMMVIEIAAGWGFNSMALLADGWHMGSHALALGLAVLAYAAARKYQRSPVFAFGTWKIEILGAYTSAIFLGFVAFFMAYESIERLLSPGGIKYNEAIMVAVIGLAVNLVCAWLLHSGNHSHDHSHHHHAHANHDHTHQHSHEDLNLKSAYVHVITDAITSLFAIVALFSGKWFGMDWLDPVMGIAGSILIAIWAYGLLRDSAKVLLDAEMDSAVVKNIRQTIQDELPCLQLNDFHAWRVGKNGYAIIIHATAPTEFTLGSIKERLSNTVAIAHLTVELQRT